jgi:hypothetical protein
VVGGLVVSAQIAAIEAEFPGWEVWQSLDSCWHARIRGAIPPVMVHAESAEELAGQIRTMRTPVRGPAT